MLVEIKGKTNRVYLSRQAASQRDKEQATFHPKTNFFLIGQHLYDLANIIKDTIESN